MVLKEGYLYKTKKVKRAFGALQSTKLRFFVLLQEPETLNAQLEYYEGKASVKMHPSELTGGGGWGECWMCMTRTEYGAPSTRNSSGITCDVVLMCYVPVSQQFGNHV